MKSVAVLERIKATVEPELEAVGLEVIDIEFGKEPIGMVLRVFIDRPSGVNLKTCAEASEMISKLLDRSDIIKSSYNLEVSSPGIERRLTKAGHFKRFVGRKIAVKAKAPVDGRKNFKGILEQAGEAGFVIRIDENTFDFRYDQVFRVNLVFEEGCDT